MKRLILFFIFFFTPLLAISDNTTHKHNITMNTQSDKSIGVVEHLGDYIPKDVYFYDSNGNKVYIMDLVKNAPTIIAPVYYSCPNVCNILQSILSSTISKISLKPGKDYQILSVSFDENDTPEIAKQKKINYLASLKNFPDDAWKFLTGNKKNIDKFMNAIGFKFKRQGRDFIHSVAIIILSKNGKIVRYIYGTRILPFDLTMALAEADKEKTGLSVKRFLTYCFSYDPEGKKYVFNIMKVSGTVILIGIALMFLILVLKGNKKNIRGKNE